MKNFYTFLIVITLISCGKKSTKNNVSIPIQFEVDTVHLDSKGEILYLGYNLSLSDFSEEKSLFYNFNLQNYSVEVLDLDRMEFVERIPFEKEGPNGVGEHVNGFQFVGRDSLYINSFHQYGIFDLRGRKILDLGFRGIFFEEKEVDDFFKSTNLNVNPQLTNQMAGVFYDWRSGDSEPVFGFLDLQKEDFQLFNFDAFDYLQHYAPRDVSSGRKQRLFWVISALSNDAILIGNNVGSNLYRFDIGNKKFRHLEFDHQLFPSRKTVKMPAETESFVDNHRNYLASQEDINFQLPIWDEDKGIYYRFSHFNIIGDDNGELKAIGAKVFLSILDRDLALMHEIEVPLLTKSPNYHFVKDGKIWIFENNEDEVSFIRLGIEGI